jgi:nickel transport protein
MKSVLVKSVLVKSVLGPTLLFPSLLLLGFSIAVLPLEVAQAHGVKLAYQNTPAIQIQATYDTGEPMTKAQVAIFAPNEPTQPWLTGTTNERGQFVFTPDPTQAGGWEVQVRQAGHGDILTIPVGEGASTAASSPARSQATGYRYTPLQQAVLVGSVIWGCIGTALYFSRGKNTKPLSEKT